MFRPDVQDVTAAFPLPYPGDTVVAGLAKIGAAFAVIHVLYAVGAVVEGASPVGLLVVLDVLAGAAFAGLALPGIIRRLPGWRRDELLAGLLALAALATLARVELSESPTAAAEWILVVTAAAFAAGHRWVPLAAAVCGAGAVLTGVQAVLMDWPGGAGPWVAVAALAVGAYGPAVAVGDVRRRAEAAIELGRRQLAEQSVQDLVTGVANRQGLLLVAQPMIDQARRQGEAVHCMMVGVDVPHDAAADGDTLLVAVAEALRGATRTTDVIARWDGDEFIVLGPGTGTSPLEMERRIRSHLALSGVVPRESWQGRISSGVATLVPWDADDLDGLLRRAAQDLALRRSLRRRAAAEVEAEDEETPAPPPADITEH